MKKVDKSSFAGTTVEQSTNIDDMQVCQPIAKPLVRRRVELRNLENEKPFLNEIIYYNGNLSLSKGRYMGEDFIELENGEIDQFEEWKPIESCFTTIAFRHCEDNAKVVVRGTVKNGEFIGEYRYKGLTWGATFNIK